MMDFITKFPRTAKQHDSIMVVMDKLTKATHFVPMKSNYKESNIVGARSYLSSYHCYNLCGTTHLGLIALLLVKLHGLVCKVESAQ